MSVWWSKSRRYVTVGSTTPHPHLCSWPVMISWSKSPPWSISLFDPLPDPEHWYYSNPSRDYPSKHDQCHISTSGGNGLLITEAMVTGQICRLADNKAAGTNGWNGLDDDVVAVGSVNAFKRELDHHHHQRAVGCVVKVSARGSEGCRFDTRVHQLSD